MNPALVALVFTLIPGFAAGQDQPFASFDLASEPVLNDPHDLDLGPDGNIHVADKFGDRIVVMDPETLELLWTYGDGALPGVHDVSIGPDGRAYAAVTGGSRVDVYQIDGQSATRAHSLPGVSRTEGALAHSNGRLYAMAGGTGQLIMFGSDHLNGAGTSTPLATPSLFFGAHDVAEGLDGTIWIAHNQERRLVQLSADLEPLKILDGPQFGFAGPRYLDVDDFGRLIVADQDAHRILMIDPDSETLLGVLGDGQPGMGPGQFDDPEGVLIVGSRYYIADSDNNRIVRYSVVMN